MANEETELASHKKWKKKCLPENNMMLMNTNDTSLVINSFTNSFVAFCELDILCSFLKESSMLCGIQSLWVKVVVQMKVIV